MTKVLFATNQAYDRLVAETVDAIVNLGIKKGGEYASGNNRLENFVHNALELRLEPEQVWAVYASKHWDAIRTYVNDIAAGYERERSELIEGRADDLIVYLMLFKALVAARRAPDGRFELTPATVRDTRQTATGPVEPEEYDILPKFLTTVDEALNSNSDDAVIPAEPNRELQAAIVSNRKKAQ